jgi:hypothetical protein
MSVISVQELAQHGLSSIFEFWNSVWKWLYHITNLLNILISWDWLYKRKLNKYMIYYKIKLLILLWFLLRIVYKVKQHFKLVFF